MLHCQRSSARAEGSGGSCWERVPRRLVGPCRKPPACDPSPPKPPGLPEKESGRAWGCQTFPAISCPSLQLSVGAITSFEDYLQMKGQTATGLQGQEGCEHWAHSNRRRRWPGSGWVVRGGEKGFCSGWPFPGFARCLLDDEASLGRPKGESTARFTAAVPSSPP